MAMNCDCRIDVRARRRLFGVFVVGSGALTITGFVIFAMLLVRGATRGEKYSAAATVSVAFERALFDDRIDDAYSLTSVRFRQQLRLDEFRELVRNYPALKGPEGARYYYHATVDESRVDSDEFTFKTEISNNGHAVCLIHVVVKERDKWKVDSVALR